MPWHGHWYTIPGSNCLLCSLSALNFICKYLSLITRAKDRLGFCSEYTMACVALLLSNNCKKKKKNTHEVHACVCWWHGDYRYTNVAHWLGPSRPIIVVLWPMFLSIFTGIRAWRTGTQIINPLVVICLLWGKNIVRKSLNNNEINRLMISPISHHSPCMVALTHWGRVTHICISKLTITSLS